MVKETISVTIQITVRPWGRFVHTLSSIIVIACPDREAGHDSEALGLVHSHME